MYIFIVTTDHSVIKNTFFLLMVFITYLCYERIKSKPVSNDLKVTLQNLVGRRGGGHCSYMQLISLVVLFQVPILESVTRSRAQYTGVPVQITGLLYVYTVYITFVTEFTYNVWTLLLYLLSYLSMYIFRSFYS